MQIVIDITEEYYNVIKAIPNRQCTADMLIIKNGTPLPKGHGDLIDRKELLKQPMDKANYPSNYVRVAKPIIEADKG